MVASGYASPHVGRVSSSLAFPYFFSCSFNVSIRELNNSLNSCSENVSSPYIRYIFTFFLYSKTKKEEFYLFLFTYKIYCSV